MKTSAANAIQAAFEKYGFKLESMGGNLTAFVRCDGAIEETVSLAVEVFAPEAMDDAVAISTCEFGDSDPTPLTGYTVADCLAALRSPGDANRYLLSRRLQHNLHKTPA